MLPEVVRSQLHKQKTADSLLILISKSRDVKSKIELLNELSFTYYNIDPEKGINIGNEALKMSKKIGWKIGIAKAYNGLGANYWARYDFIKAQDYYGAALKIAQEIKDQQQIEKNFHDIGMCYESQNIDEKALEYYQKGAILSKYLGDKDHELGCYGNIADIFFKQSKYNNALKFYRLSFQISKQVGNKRNMAYFYWRFGEVYNLMGRVDDALKYELISLQIFKELKDYEDLAPNMNSLGNLYLQRRGYQQAIIQNQNALQILKQIKGSLTKKMESDFYFSIGKIYFKWAQHTNTISNKPFYTNGKKTAYLRLALKNLQKSISLSKSVGFKENIIESLKNLSDVLLMQGQFSKALKTYKEYIIYKDSSYTLKKGNEYLRHELAFEYSKKRDSLNYVTIINKKETEQAKTIAATRLKQHSLYAIIAIVVLLLFTSYFIFRNHIQKIRFTSQIAKEKSEAELTQVLFENKLNDLTLASLKSQMKPHFIFNCLNSIKLYIEKNDTEAASLYITKFSKLIRNVLDSARSEKVTLTTEIELVELYLYMEHMRLKDKLQYKFEIAENMETDFIEIPPLLIQPYVENTIWHGLMNKAEGGIIELSIKTSPDEKCLIVSIMDNGIGREKAAELKGKKIFQHVSLGSKLSDERIAVINAKYKTNTQVSIMDLKDIDNNASGTLVTASSIKQCNKS